MSARDQEAELSTITYHRFVKTTPKPRATKNNKGELVGPLEEAPDVAAAGVVEVVADGLGVV
jgi:hypothetical protein